MTPHGRKYGEKDSHPSPWWNGGFEHYARIGGALWVFLWCIDAITKEVNGTGLVLGGAPVKLERIVGDLKGAHKETVRRHLKNLADENYIRTRRTPYGQIIEVLNSKKFDIWRKQKPQNVVSLPQEKPIHEPEKPTGGSEKPQNMVSKEDSAVTQQEDAAVRRLPVWDFLGVKGSGFPSQVREVCSRLYQSKNGQTPVDFIGACMDGIQGLGLRIPPALAHRATELRAKARTNGLQPLPDLEPIPWAT